LGNIGAIGFDRGQTKGYSWYSRRIQGHELASEHRLPSSLAMTPLFASWAFVGNRPNLLVLIFFQI